MKLHRSACLAVILAALWLTAPLPAPAAVPVAPILPTDYLGWTNAYRLHNEQMEAVLVPAIGRLVHLTLTNGESPLRLEPAMHGKTPDTNEPFFNIGGDWLWPVAQARWPALAENGHDWPPPPLLADLPWECSAWTADDGQQCVQFSRTYGEPLNIVVTRQFTLAPTAAELVVHQRIERTAPSEIPVVLWNISQVAQPDQVLLPVATPSAFRGGLKTLMGHKPDRRAMRRCGAAAIYTPAPGSEVKLGSDSPAAWVAARRGSVLIVETATTSATGNYPDGGATVEIYSNHGLGYAEIETLSPEVALAPATVLENTLRIRLAATPKATGGCKLAEAAQSLAAP